MVASMNTFQRIALATAAIAIAAAILYPLLSQNGNARERIPVRIGTPAAGRLLKSDAEWKAVLSPEAYRITRERGTELPFSAAGHNSKADGEYHCVCCQQPLFDSSAKFDSGTGWPSFFQPLNENAISLFGENSRFDDRTEVVCSRCDAHLGHVFTDGPRPTGLRYCMNTGALTFAPR